MKRNPWLAGFLVLLCVIPSALAAPFDDAQGDRGAKFEIESGFGAGFKPALLA